MIVKGHRPILALVVEIEEIFHHCAKALPALAAVAAGDLERPGSGAPGDRQGAGAGRGRGLSRSARARPRTTAKPVSRSSCTGSATVATGRLQGARGSPSVRPAPAPRKPVHAEHARPVVSVATRDLSCDGYRADIEST